MRINCSIILEMVFGATFILPKKYPFKMEDKEIKGRVRAIACNIGLTAACFKRFLAIQGEEK